MMTFKEAVLLLLLTPMLILLTISAMLLRPGLLFIATGFALAAALVQRFLKEDMN